LGAVSLDLYGNWFLPVYAGMADDGAINLRSRRMVGDTPDAESVIPPQFSGKSLSLVEEFAHEWRAALPGEEKTNPNTFTRYTLFRR